jgi:hypothetical protein
LLSKTVNVKFYKIAILPVVLCWCELREDHGLKVSYNTNDTENNIWNKRDEIMRCWRIEHVLSAKYNYSDQVKEDETAWHVARIGEKCMQIIWTGLIWLSIVASGGFL